MAAEFLFTFGAEGVLKKVSSLVNEQISLAWGFKEDLKKLGESLSLIQNMLNDAAEKPQALDRGKTVEGWVKKLKGIADDADNVLDECNYEVLRRKVELHNHMKKKVLNFLSASNPILFRRKMANRIKHINASLLDLKSEASSIGLIEKRIDATPHGVGLGRHPTDSMFERDEKVIGRKDDVLKIVESLTNSDNRQINLSVIAIVGMAGLGKTTLAKSVYNESAIDTHFHKKIWVCVSNTFEVETILSQMVDSVIPEKAGMKSQDALLKVLKDELKEKRYVLVLDDVWNDDSKKWESLMSCLSKLNSNPGSSIIITTRIANVASIPEKLPGLAKTLLRLELTNLSTEECWFILKQRALIDDNDFIDADREKIGKAIAAKCGGVPLAAKVLGSIMRSKTSRDEWLAIQESEIWDLTKEEDRIMSVLKLSFNNLKSPPLKQCFAYCSMLKKDFEIERDNLIQLWMAQGLLQLSTDNHDEMEDTGKKYFYTLLKNSLFQEVTEGGTITKYTMHDLVHDLAEEVSKSESLTQDLNDTCEVRHVARIRPSTLENMSEVTVRRLHSLFSNDQVPDIIFSKFRALRVLNLHRANIQELPDSFGKLKHLRYLDVSYSRIKALPKSIGKLYNLQTLRMQGTDYLKEVPREMQNLINLRHLYFDKTMEFPAGLLRGLTNLRTLSYFNVGKEMGVGIEELVGLNHLKGKLIIRNLENIRDEEEAKKAKLEDKKNVLELSYVWARSRSNPEGLESRPSSNINDENVLEGLKPHTKLESLRIENFMGDKFPSWMMRNPLPLNNLKKVLLSGCRKCEKLPILGHLPGLGHVEISDMHNLKRLGSEFYGYNHVYEAAVATREKETVVLFPALKTLIIEWCGELTEWMEAPTTMASSTTRKVVVFPCLEKLTLWGCPLLRNAPSHFPSLKELKIYRMDSEKPMASICNEVSTLTSLEINNIEGLTSLSSGMLKKNKNLTSLWIWRCDEMIRIAPNVFGCCANLRSLTIWNCKKLEQLAEGLDTLPLLEKLTISQCPTLEFIPIDHDMASLRELKIEYCDGLSSIGLLDHCTSLQELEIGGCGNLTSIPISQGLASLRRLGIWECGGLTGLPCGIENCPSLQTLWVSECPKLASISFSTDLNPCLKELHIEDCNGLQSLPDFRSFTSLLVLEIRRCASLVCGFHIPVSLEKLRISECHNLESIPCLEECTSLRQLEVRDCEKLKSLSTGLRCLARLEKLDLGPFWEELDFFPDFQAPSQQLDELELSGWPKLKSLPQQVQHFTSLTSLALRSFNGVEALPEWLGNLASLKRLIISDCENLKSLPSLKAMQRLTKLYILGIRRCPLLKERCTEDSGEEWPKISHIPLIYLPDDD